MDATLTLARVGVGRFTWRRGREAAVADSFLQLIQYASKWGRASRNKRFGFCRIKIKDLTPVNVITPF